MYIIKRFKDYLKIKPNTQSNRSLLAIMSLFYKRHNLSELVTLDGLKERYDFL